MELTCGGCGSQGKIARLIFTALKEPISTRKQAACWPIVLPVGLAVALLTYKLSSIAGLHRDEAAFGLFAESILAGARPLTGFFNDYTAPLHSYLVAASFALLGESTFALRIGGVLCNLAALGLYYAIVRRLWPKAALSALWLLATFPLFVVFSRISGENYALNPLLLCGGIWAYLRASAAASPRQAGAWWLISGLLFGLGCWNHVVALPTVASVVVVYLACARPPWTLLRRGGLWVWGGVLLAALPKLYLIIFNHASWLPEVKGPTERLPFLNAWANLVYTLGGDALYARATGQVAFSLNGLLPLAMLLSAAALLLARPAGAAERRLGRGLLAVFVLSALGSWLITPAYLVGSRIWLLPLWFVPAILAAGMSTWPAMVRRTVVTVLVGGNLFALGYDYFYTFQKTGGAVQTQVNVGGRTDNSTDFVDFTPLAEKLRRVPGQPAIYVEDYRPYRLWFLLPEARERIHVIDQTAPTPWSFPPGSLLAVFRAPDTGDLADGEEMKVGGVPVKYRADLSTANQVVLQVLAK